VTLLAPRLLAARNVYRRHPHRAWGLIGLSGVFWVGCLMLFVKVLGYFQTIGEFGPLLTQRLLLLVFLSFFVVLLISNTVTALTTFYLADDLDVLVAAPVSLRRLHRARFVDTLVSSSWMVMLFGLPAFVAYGIVYDAGPVFYGATVLVLLPYFVVPTALGILVTTGLVMVFPARRTRDAMLVGVGLLVVTVVAVIRTLQPEQLAHPSGLAGLAGFLAGFDASGSPYLPTTWAAEVLLPLLGARDGDAGFHFAMLVSTAAMLYVVSATVVEQVFLTAWSRAQTGRVRDVATERPLSRWLERLARPLPRVPALLVQKDLTVFLRDASQWSQLLLLFAVVGLYVYNFSVLPLDDGSALGRAMRDIATVLNLGLAAFVSTAIAVRFVYPMVSLEGRAWWILRTAPVALGRVWWSKFWIGYVPLFAFAALLIGATNGYLAVPSLLTGAFVVTLVPLTAALVSLGLGFGAAYPRLDAQNAAQIATGFGAVVYMVTSLALITLVMALEAWPTWRLLRHARAAEPFGHGEVAGFVVAYAAALFVMAATFVMARRVGLRALERLPI